MLNQTEFQIRVNQAVKDVVAAAVLGYLSGRIIFQIDSLVCAEICALAALAFNAVPTAALLITPRKYHN